MKHEGHNGALGRPGDVFSCKGVGDLLLQVLWTDLDLTAEAGCSGGAQIPLDGRRLAERRGEPERICGRIKPSRSNRPTIIKIRLRLPAAVSEFPGHDPQAISASNPFSAGSKKMNCTLFFK
jgi:hypothetical protein